MSASTGAAGPPQAGPSREDIVFGRAVIAFQLATKVQVEAAAAEQKRLQGQNRNVTLAQVLVGQRLISVEQYRRIVQEIQSRTASQLPGASGLDIQVRQPGATGLDLQLRQPPGATGLDLRNPAASSAARPGNAATPSGRVAAANPANSSNGRGNTTGSHARPRPPEPAPAPLLLPPDVTPSGRYVPSKLGIRLAGGSRFPEQAEQAQLPPSEEELEAAAKSWEQSREEIARSNDPKLASTQGDPGYEVVESTGQIDKPRPEGLAAKKLTTPQAAKERRDAGIRKMLGVDENAEEFDFGPYRILGEVASGGMGIIYRAVDTSTGNVYALKALLNVESANEKQLKRFIAEAQSAMRLDHPGIVKIYDLGVFENIPYFTMDMIPGKDLHHILREKSLSSEKVLKILKKVCEAVDYAHQQGVIHRDLKPANIIVRPDEVPVLTDFGLAKNLDSQHKLTAENAMVGTPLYLSPEQVSGKANLVDGRCDVYGLGVMLYQILTDRLPFFGRNPYEVYRKVMEEDPIPPTQINPAISPEVEKICLMALAKDREERYASAKAMSEDLGRFLRGEPVTAKIPSPAKKKPPAAPDGTAPVPPPKTGVPVGLIVGLVIFGLVIVSGVAYIVMALVGQD